LDKRKEADDKDSIDSKEILETEEEGAKPTISQSAACRICLGEEEEPENPLITPCKCTGTAGTIHINCLTEWLNSKRETRHQGNCRAYLWNVIKCDLCQEPFPESFRHKGKDLPIF